MLLKSKKRKKKVKKSSSILLIPRPPPEPPPPPPPGARHGGATPLPPAGPRRRRRRGDNGHLHTFGVRMKRVFARRANKKKNSMGHPLGCPILLFERLNPPPLLHIKKRANQRHEIIDALETFSLTGRGHI